MRQKGIVLTCDRCGKSEFLKRLPDTYSYANSKGITGEEIYQEPEYGWSEIVICGERKDLCPDCSKVYEDFEKSFMENK